MYYLSCVASVIQYNLDYKLRDYKNYFRLNPEEKTAVYTQAVKLNPKIFIEAGVFKVGSEFLRKGNMNEFIKITDERIGVHVNQELMIGGRSVRVLKILAFENKWLNRYYILTFIAIAHMKIFLNFFGGDLGIFLG